MAQSSNNIIHLCTTTPSSPHGQPVGVSPARGGPSPRSLSRSRNGLVVCPDGWDPTPPPNETPTEPAAAVPALDQPANIDGDEENMKRWHTKKSAFSPQKALEPPKRWDGMAKEGVSNTCLKARTVQHISASPHTARHRVNGSSVPPRRLLPGVPPVYHRAAANHDRPTTDPLVRRQEPPWLLVGPARGRGGNDRGNDSARAEYRACSASDDGTARYPTTGVFPRSAVGSAIRCPTSLAARPSVRPCNGPLMTDAEAGWPDRVDLRSAVAVHTFLIITLPIAIRCEYSASAAECQVVLFSCSVVPPACRVPDLRHRKI